MPQVDLESLVCGGDPKVACETTFIPSQPDPDPDPYPEPDPDLPAESFRIPIAGSLEYWLDNINPVYDRDDSTKGTTNPKSHLQHHHHHQQQGPTASSQRFSRSLRAAAKAPIIALPNKIQHHSGYLAQRARKPQARIFPKKTVRGVSDPGSPKVSCFGNVLLEREKSRRRSPEVDVRDGGCWAGFRCIGRRRAAAAAAAEEELGGLGSGTRKNVAVMEGKVASTAAETAPAGEPPGLGGTKRFLSGRRAASWGGDGEVVLEEGHVG